VEGGSSPCVMEDLGSDNGVRLTPRLPAHTMNNAPETFGVDAVLNAACTQAEVFDRVFQGAASLCNLVDQGLNVTVLAYGATGATHRGVLCSLDPTPPPRPSASAGSGKTHTVLGRYWSGLTHTPAPDEAAVSVVGGIDDGAGLIPRVVDALLNPSAAGDTSPSTPRRTVAVQCVEVYNVSGAGRRLSPLSTSLSPGRSPRGRAGRSSRSAGGGPSAPSCGAGGRSAIVVANHHCG